LPLHHAFAFTTNLLLPILAGARITMAENIRTVARDMQETGPTVLIAVPLMLEKMHARMQDGIQESKVANLLMKVGLKRAVANRIRKKLGGQIRMIVTGGAACDAALIKGLDRMGLPVIEGYGLTETGPVLAINPPGKARAGSVGKALPGVELKIVDPNNDGVGEIAVRGQNIMKGYFNNPEASAECMRDGWFLTGDLGMLDSKEYLTITGRKKNVIVNREGKNIYPQEIENEVCRSKFIREAIVLPYSDADNPVGEKPAIIVVPDAQAINEHAEHKGKTLSQSDIDQFVRDEVKSTTRR
ncbi:unnamed protein product, partial [marine sediment metagenome]